MSALTLLERVAADKNADEARWFEARRNGVTATDVAKLEKGGASVRAQLLEEKRTGERTFFGNAYTAWGLEREPVIGEWVESTFGHKPSDVTFHADGNVRHLATPDGLHIKDGIVTIAEIKTSKHWLEPGTDAFIESHYMAQCQWQMMVTGVMECLFVWEVRDGEPGDFKPGERGHAWIERDNGHIAELVGIAEQFLDELDNGVEDDPEDYAELIRERVWKMTQRKRVDDEIAQIDEQILARIGQRDSFHIETQFGKLSYTTPKPSERFDTTTFKKVHPDMWRDFVKLSQSKPSLRVTPVQEATNDVF